MNVDGNGAASLLMMVPLAGPALKVVPGGAGLLRLERYVLRAVIRWARPIPPGARRARPTGKERLRRLETAARELEVVLDAGKGSLARLSTEEIVSHVKQRIRQFEARLCDLKQERAAVEQQVRDLERNETALNLASSQVDMMRSELKRRANVRQRAAELAALNARHRIALDLLRDLVDEWRRVHEERVTLSKRAETGEQGGTAAGSTSVSSAGSK
ncbi:Uncharacterized protein PBTT_07847 [Plasmodiophora brassicae]